MTAQAWSCLGCGQRNSGWSHECGRCGVINGQASIYDLAAQLKSIKPPHLPGLHLDKPLDEALDLMMCETSLHDDTRERLVRDVVVREAVARDAAVRQQLAALGWATPERARALSDAVLTLGREIERLRLALAEEVADRLDRALSPNNYQPPPVPPDKL